MGSQTTFCDMLSCSSSSLCFVVLKTSSPKTKTTLRPSSSNFAFQTPPPLQVKPTNTHSLKPTYPYFLRRFSRTKTRATLDEKEQSATPLLEQDEQQQQQPSRVFLFLCSFQFLFTFFSVKFNNFLLFSAPVLHIR